jgi:membrane-associated phospholipid phosphatase
LLACLPIGAFRIDEILERTGYRTLRHEPDAKERFYYGLLMLYSYVVPLLLTVATFQIIKYSLKRPRPTHVPGTYRIGHGILKKAEKGTYSMPSGDASAVGVFCFVMAAVPGLPALYVICPLVCLGRVYYQMHYIGDVVAGASLGTIWAAIYYVLFEHVCAKLFRHLLGEDSFLPPVEYSPSA